MWMSTGGCRQTKLKTTLRGSDVGVDTHTLRDLQQESGGDACLAEDMLVDAKIQKGLRCVPLQV